MCSKVDLSRSDITDENGEPVKRSVWSKAVKDFRLRNVYTDKTVKFRENIKERILLKAVAPTTKCSSVRRRVTCYLRNYSIMRGYALKVDFVMING